MHLLQTYEAQADYGLNVLRETKDLNNVIHHYCHGLAVRNMNNDMQTSNTLRNLTFHLVLRNLESRRMINSKHIQEYGSVEQDWPEHLKTVIEAGNHLTTIGSLSDRKKACILIKKLLNELLNVTHQKQQDAVIQMIASTEHNLGTIYIESNNYKTGLKHFKKRLDYLEKISLSIGDHILFQPLHDVANAYAAIGKHAEAFKLFERASGIGIRLWGEDNLQLAYIYCNYGTALYYFSEEQKRDVVSRRHNLIRSKRLLQNALASLKKHDIANQEPSYVQAETYLGYVSVALSLMDTSDDDL